MKDLLKVYEDILTAHVIIQRLAREYTKSAFSVKKKSIISFKLIFPDGWADICWEDGCIYREILKGQKLFERRGI